MFVTSRRWSSGVEVRPIKLIAGNSPFCETFFTDVKVPKENLVGPLNGGWTVAKRLLGMEPGDPAPWVERVVPEDRQSLDAALSSLAASGAAAFSFLSPTP